MADHLTRDLTLPQREDLYGKLNEASTLLREKNAPQVAKRHLADATEDEEELVESPKPMKPVKARRITLATDFQKLGLLHRLYFYFLSIFSRKSADHIFRQTRLNEVRQEISRLNSDLIAFDRNNKIYLISPYMADRFNAVFRLTLEVLPIINQIERNPKFMENIVLKLIFEAHNSRSESPIQIETANFITEEEFRKHVFMGDGATTVKITALMEDVIKEGKNLPFSLYTYGAKVLLALYQFQRICYFPFSSFFHTFRTDNTDQENIYSAVLPQSAYESMHMLYQLIKEVGTIDLDKTQFQEIIRIYVLVASGKEQSKQTTLDYMNSFLHLQDMWNGFIKQMPIEQLLLFTAENPYLELPTTSGLENEVLEHLPTEVEKVYQSVVQKNIMATARTLRESRNKFFFQKYFSEITFEYSKFYNNTRADLQLKRNLPDSEAGVGPFAHCESFAYARNFLRNFGNENLVRPLNILAKGVFKSDNYVYNRVIDFLNVLETHKAKLNIIEQNLEPDHRVDMELKSILMRLEQRVDGAKEEYTTLLMNLDREIRSLIEGLVKDMQDFAVHTIPIIETLMQDHISHQRFNSFIERFPYLHDFNNPVFHPLSPEKILVLWKQYISEFTLLLHDQLELERQSILGQVSHIANKRSLRKNLRF